MFAPLTWLLAAFYALWPSFGFAIVALTLTVLAALTPLSLHQLRTTAAMQRIQPELTVLRRAHAHDRHRLQHETIALYRAHGITPASGCLPAVVQVPVMIVMYQVIRGLTHHGPNGELAPLHLDHGTALYKAIQDQGGRMVSWGVDLAARGFGPHGSAAAALPFAVLALLVVATGFWQQHLALQRAAALRRGAASPGVGIVRLLPALTGVLALSLPAGVAVYHVVANLCRVAQQYALGPPNPL